jgi:hypothetical protein
VSALAGGLCSGLTGGQTYVACSDVMGDANCR